MRIFNNIYLITINIIIEQSKYVFCLIFKKYGYEHEIYFRDGWCDLILLEYDYDKIKETNKRLNKEFIKWYYHPLRIDNWINEINE
jgi:hypothetical protein